MKVSWDDDIPNIWEVIKFMFQPNNQSIFGRVFRWLGSEQAIHISLLLPKRIQSLRTSLLASGDLHFYPERCSKVPPTNGGINAKVDLTDLPHMLQTLYIGLQSGAALVFVAL